MGLDAPWHWVIIALMVVALFGYKKLPEMSRSVAQSLRAFKSEMRVPTYDDHAPAAPVPAVAPIVAPAVTPVAPAVEAG